MKILKTFTIIILGVIISSSSFAQGVKRSKFEVKSIVYPSAPIKDVKSYVIYLHSGGAKFGHRDIDNKKYIKKYNEIIKGTKYYTFKEYTLNHSNPDLKIEIAFGNFKTGEKVLRQHNIPCKQAGAKLTKDNIQECPAFYYEVTYTLPAILKVSDASGNILYITDIKPKGVETFGYDSKGLSGYLAKSKLDEAYNSSGSSAVRKDATRSQLTLLNKALQQAICFSNTQDRFNIATGKGKSHNYDDLDVAQANALKAFKTGANLTTALKSSIDTWEKAVKEENLGDNKARINRKVATEIRFNLALAYMYTNQFDKAMVHAKKGREYAKFATDQSKSEMARRIYRYVKNRNIQYQNNKGISISGKQIPLDGGILARTIAIKAKDLPYNLVTAENKFAAFSDELKTFKADKKANDEASTSSASSSGGSANKWSSSVVNSAGQGMTLMLPYRNIKDADMKDICELTMLNQAVLNNNKITTVPNSISNLANLTKLQLAANQITELPESIGKLGKLKNLNISKNPISKLPTSMKNLKNLKTLSMKGTKIPQSEVDALQKALPNCKIKL